MPTHSFHSALAGHPLHPEHPAKLFRGRRLIVAAAESGRPECHQEDAEAEKDKHHPV